MPSANPANDDISAPEKPMNSEMRPPYSTRE